MKGFEGAALRVAIGGGVQLSTYDQCRALVLSTKYFKEEDVYTTLVSSLVASVLVCTVMTPFDVACTRLYNQKGNLYTGPIDCLIKTIKAEGIRGVYKGYVAHYFRLGPHITLTFLFFEKLKQYWSYYIEEQH